MEPIKVAITDDEVLFLKGLSLFIKDFDGMELVLEANSGKELMDQLSSGKILPDVLLLDLKMPEMSGVEVAKLLSVNYPSIKIIIISTYFSKAFVINLVEIGVSAYLAKNTAPEEVELTIRNVFEKGFYYSDAVMKIIRESFTEKKKVAKPSFLVELTDREKEVLQLICEQLTNTEIGEKLFISARTVEGHRNNLLQKLNCRNTAGLVAFAYQYQLIHIDPSMFW